MTGQLARRSKAEVPACANGVVSLRKRQDANAFKLLRRGLSTRILTRSFGDGCDANGNPRFPLLIGEDKIVSFASGARPDAAT